MWRIRGRYGAAVSDVGISESESGFPVVLLLRRHAIESDHARTGMCNRRVPYTQPEASTAQVLSHDIEAEEGEARIVIDAGYGRRRSAVELAYEEALRIDCDEAGVVGEARIPAFGRGPVHRYRDFLRPHRPDAKTVHDRRSYRGAWLIQGE
jgi:hypothetical protein